MDYTHRSMSEDVLALKLLTKDDSMRARREHIDAIHQIAQPFTSQSPEILARQNCGRMSVATILATFVTVHQETPNTSTSYSTVRHQAGPLSRRRAGQTSRPRPDKTEAACNVASSST
jgi:hypothetical protein